MNGRYKLKKRSKANLTPKRQRTQYSCMSTSMSMCLQALGYAHADEDEVNKVMGALPMQGASWEQALACAQHYGCRATLTTPSTVRQLKEWTDRGVPVMIAWNPEGRDWSHASVVFDVSDDLKQVSVADPNIPDPEETVRVLSSAEFYKTWYEKWPNYLVRRPACAIEREITPDGRQVMASNKGNKMTRKLTAKDLLKEVQQIKSAWSRNSHDHPHDRKFIKEIEKATNLIFLNSEDQRYGLILNFLPFEDNWSYDQRVSVEHHNPPNLFGKEYKEFFVFEGKTYKNRKALIKALTKVRKLKKMSSSSGCEPNEIEYKDEADLESQVDSAMESIFYGWGDVSTKIEQRSNSKVYITFQGTAELDAHSPWWHRAGTKHSINFLGPHLAKLLGKGYDFEIWDDIPQIITPYFYSHHDDADGAGRWFLPFRTWKEVANIDDKLLIEDLSGHYEKDLKTIAKFIKKNTPRV